jgi:hypothetical protein
MRRGYGIFLLGLLVCAAFLALLDPSLREPNYQGKPLSAWLNDFDNEKPEVRHHAVDAVRHIGARAVPHKR